MVDSRVSDLRGNARLIPVDSPEATEHHDGAQTKTTGLVVRALGQVWGWLVAQRRNAIASRELAALDDALLRDIGIERSQIAAAVVGPTGRRARHSSHAVPSSVQDVMLMSGLNALR